MRIVGGNGQTDTVLATLPLQVELRGADNLPAKGTVIWMPEDQPIASSDADARGIASYSWTLRSTNQPAQYLDAQIRGRDDRVHFSVRSEGGRPVRLGKEFQGVVDAQIGVVGQPVFWNYGVFGFDAYGNDNASGALDIVWNVVAGGGSMSGACGTECWCPLPPSKCVFYHSARHILGPVEGENTVIASAPQLPNASPLTFTTIGVTGLVEVRAFNVQKAKDAVFEPAIVTVPVGKTVGWLWVGDFDAEHIPYFEKHDVVFEDDPSTPASAPARVAGTHLRKFLAPGTYRYRCTLHSTDFTHGEIGQVTVVPASI